MLLFQSILSEITERLHDKATFKERVALSISSVIGIAITCDQLTVIDGKVCVSVSPTIKSVIRLKQEPLVEVLKKYKVHSVV